MSWVRAIFSIIIVYHLYVMVLTPVSESLLGRVLLPSYVDYANIVGINTPWQFSAPLPAENMRIDYEIRFPEDMGQAPFEGSFPDWYGTGTLDPMARRDLFVTRFFMRDPATLGEAFGPWLCRNHPEALQVQSEFFVRELPSLERAIEFPEAWQEEVTERSVASFTHLCGRGPSSGGDL